MAMPFTKPDNLQQDLVEFLMTSIKLRRDTIVYML